MKKNILFYTAFFCIMAIYSQEEQSLELLKSDTTWIKEIIKFPIGFAPEIKYQGYEDLRFPKGWSKQESPNFWSYAWVWSLNNTNKLTEKELEANIQYYFDGLLGLDYFKIEEKSVRKTNAVFINIDAENFNYIGKVKTFDTRYSKKTMTLHVIAQQFYCSESNKTIIFFKFSPKDFNHTVWKTLDEVALINTKCTNK